MNSIEIPGSDVVVRVGSLRPYLERRGPDEPPAGRRPTSSPPRPRRTCSPRPSGDRASACTRTRAGDRGQGGRYGPYVTEALPEDAEGKPQDCVTLSLDVAGDRDPGRGTAAARCPGRWKRPTERRSSPTAGTARSSRRGPETRSLESEEQLFTLTVDEALSVLAQPRRRRGQAAAAAAPRLGPDPGSGRPILVKEGRFGPYVTDGETNASLRRTDDVESITLERATELRPSGARRGRPSHARAVAGSGRKPRKPG